MSRHTWYTSHEGKSLCLEMGWDQWRGLSYSLWEPNAWREEKLLGCSHYDDATPIHDMDVILAKLNEHGIVPPESVLQAVLADQSNRDGDRKVEHN